MQKVAGNTTEVADQLVESPRPGSPKFHQGGQVIHQVGFTKSVRGCIV